MTLAAGALCGVCVLLAATAVEAQSNAPAEQAPERIVITADRREPSVADQGCTPGRANARSPILAAHAAAVLAWAREADAYWSTDGLEAIANGAVDAENVNTAIAEVAEISGRLFDTPFGDFDNFDDEDPESRPPPPAASAFMVLLSELASMPGVCADGAFLAAMNVAYAPQPDIVPMFLREWCDRRPTHRYGRSEVRFLCGVEELHLASLLRQQGDEAGAAAAVARSRSAHWRGMLRGSRGREVLASYLNHPMEMFEDGDITLTAITQLGRTMHWGARNQPTALRAALIAVARSGGADEFMSSLVFATLGWGEAMTTQDYRAARALLSIVHRVMEQEETLPPHLGAYLGAGFGVYSAATSAAEGAFARAERETLRALSQAEQIRQAVAREGEDDDEDRDLSHLDEFRNLAERVLLSIRLERGTGGDDVALAERVFSASAREFERSRRDGGGNEGFEVAGEDEAAIVFAARGRRLAAALQSAGHAEASARMQARAACLMAEEAAATSLAVQMRALKDAGRGDQAEDVISWLVGGLQSEAAPVGADAEDEEATRCEPNDAMRLNLLQIGSGLRASAGLAAGQARNVFSSSSAREAAYQLEETLRDISGRNFNLVDLRPTFANMNQAMSGLIEASSWSDTASYFALRNATLIASDRVASALNAGEAAIQYTTFDDATYVSVITQNGLSVVRLAVSRVELEAAVAQLRAGLRIPARATDLPVYDLSAAHRLYQRIFAPIVPELQGVQTLFVVPSAAIAQLPMQTLVSAAADTPSPGDFASYRNARWLGDDYRFAVLPSLTSLVLIRNRLSFQDQDSTLVIAEPDLSAARVRFASLPSTESLRSALAGAEQDLSFVLGADASEATLRAMSADDRLSRARFVLFNTHGLSAAAAQGLGVSSPALVLTPTGGDDGLLTPAEIMTLKLRADWVMLLACESAAGDATGAEPLSGLANAFFYAGARSLIVSHWRVEAGATLELATRFVADGAQVSAGERLQRAEAALRNAGDAGPQFWAHPAFWAPFSIVGDPAASRF